jgi:lipopolysaccharide transport system ATP-binding protein
MAFVRLENVSVQLPAHLSETASLRTLLAKSIWRKGEKTRRKYVTVLDDVSFDLSDGDRVGLIGANGAGKTTLLRCMASIFEPSRGRLVRDGRMTALLGAPEGLELEMSGYEFVKLSARTRRLSERRTRALVEDIESFTELGEALERPIRTYSTGMIARLSFAIRTSDQPEILLMDEWLAAGDARFVKRANERLKRFVNRSAILVIATHSDALIRTWCSKVVLLHHGRIVCIDQPEAALEARDRQFFDGK